MQAVFDTCILIDYLIGNPSAKAEFAKFEKKLISIITWAEVLVGAKDQKEEELLTRFLSGFQVVDLGQEIAKLAVDLRKSHKLRLPDAIVWATAKNHGALFVTRDTKDFPADDTGIRIPYK